MTTTQGKNHFVLQPIVNMATGATLYSEMLFRFADGRNVQEAILRAEAARTIHEIDLAVLEEAVKLIAGADAITVAVNVSPVTVELHLSALVDAIQALNGRACQLVVELTETAPILDLARVAQFTNAMQKAGVRVALDDYGCGFCDATHAAFLNPDFIKVPRAGRNGWSTMPPREWTALRDLAAMAKSQLVGEGIETEQHLQQVCELGLEFGQGFYFSNLRRVDAEPGVAPSHTTMEGLAWTTRLPAAR